MTIGTVRWFDVRKGYGFLKPDDGGVDVLVDVCAVERAGIASLNQGQRLSFEVVNDKRIGQIARRESRRFWIAGRSAHRHCSSLRSSHRSIARASIAEPGRSRQRSRNALASWRRNA